MGVRRLAVANEPNIFQMLLVLRKLRKLRTYTIDTVLQHVQLNLPVARKSMTDIPIKTS